MGFLSSIIGSKVSERQPQQASEASNHGQEGSPAIRSSDEHPLTAGDRESRFDRGSKPSEFTSLISGRKTTLTA